MPRAVERRDQVDPGNTIMAMIGNDNLPTEVTSPASLSQWLSSGVGLVVVVGVLLAVLLLLWAMYGRRRKRGGAATLARSSAPVSKGRRKVRQEHRIRKPTLAETGGLPPLRDADPPKPS